MNSSVNISIVAVLHNYDSSIEEFVSSLCALLGKHFKYYEVVFVDDGSKDNTVEKVESLQKKYENIQLYCLPRSRGEHIAMNVGLENTIGDFVITLNPRKDPPDLIPQLMKVAIEDGKDMVYALPEERISGWRPYDIGSRLFFAFLVKISDIDVPTANSTYRLFSRAVLNYILELEDRNRTLSIAPGMSGFPYTTINYKRIGKKRHHRPSAIRGLLRGLDLVVSTSTLPLRFVTLLSVGISVASLIYGVVVVFIRFAKEDVASGWASISLEISAMFFLAFFILAVMSEYLVRIVEATNKRPLYHISKESFSSVIRQPELNVRSSEGSNESTDEADVRGDSDLRNENQVTS